MRTILFLTAFLIGLIFRDYIFDEPTFISIMRGCLMTNPFRQDGCRPRRGGGLSSQFACSYWRVSLGLLRSITLIGWKLQSGRCASGKKALGPPGKQPFLGAVLCLWVTILGFHALLSAPPHMHREVTAKAEIKVELWQTTVIKHVNGDGVLVWAQLRNVGKDARVTIGNVEALTSYGSRYMGNRQYVTQPINLPDKGKTIKLLQKEQLRDVLSTPMMSGDLRSGYILVTFKELGTFEDLNKFISAGGRFRVEVADGFNNISAGETDGNPEMHRPTVGP